MADLPPSKPYAESCDQNREPILAVIAPYLRSCRRLLEIGSGTGQHAVYFAAKLPHLYWQTSDRRAAHAGIWAWTDDAGRENIGAPLALDVLHDAWPETSFDAVFSANTAHIMDAGAVAAMLTGVARVLRPGGLFLLYGPFNRDGAYTSESNRAFDHWLKARDPASGIKDMAWLNELAADAGLEALAEHEMPANNLMLVWRRAL